MMALDTAGAAFSLGMAAVMAKPRQHRAAVPTMTVTNRAGRVVVGTLIP